MWHLIHRITGIVTVRIDGNNAERFLNLCKNKNVVIYNISADNGICEIDVPAKEILTLKKVRSKCMVKLRIVKKRGALLWIRRKRNVYSFTLGIIIYFVIIFFLQGNIYEVEIVGCQKYKEEDIKNFLGEMGIKEGINKKKINLKDIEFSIRDEYYGIIWVTAYTDGSKLLVEIKESEYN